MGLEKMTITGIHYFVVSHVQKTIRVNTAHL